MSKSKACPNADPIPAISNRAIMFGVLTLLHGLSQKLTGEEPFSYAAGELQPLQGLKIQRTDWRPIFDPDQKAEEPATVESLERRVRRLEMELAAAKR